MRVESFIILRIQDAITLGGASRMIINNYLEDLGDIDRTGRFRIAAIAHRLRTRVEIIGDRYRYRYRYRQSGRRFSDDFLASIRI